MYQTQANCERLIDLSHLRSAELPDIVLQATLIDSSNLPKQHP